MIDRIFLRRYKATQFLGEGGMSTVWLAQDLKEPRQAVVKLMKSEFNSDPKCREAFRREIDFLNRFRHPYAVTFYEASLDAPHGPCLAMEYVAGEPLDALLARHGRLSPHRVGHLLGQLCTMLHSLHGQGYVHRDLKPANVLVLGADTPEERIKLIDFGLARKLVGATETPYIAIEKLSNYASGTPDYMSPEQLQGSAMDHRGDIYSVGVILYELLTGSRPFLSDSVAEVLLAHAEKPPPAFDRKLGILRPVEEVVRDCLAKSPQHRPQSARDLAIRFGKALGRPVWDEEGSQALASSAAAASAAADEPAAEAHDPSAAVYKLEAWMPEQIAEMKLRGFLNDLGGEVTESVPGLIRVYLKRPRAGAETPAPSAGGLLGWLGFGKKAPPPPEPDLVEMEVRMAKPPDAKGNQLNITLSLRMARGQPEADWQNWCDQIVRQVSAYLMAKRVD